MVVSTQTCRKFDHPEFVLELENDALAQHARVLLGSIENLVARGEVLNPGETFQFGWITLQIRALDAGRLTLYEPDMVSSPIEYIPGANKTILQMMLQLFTLDSFDIERARMAVPNFRQTAMVCNQFAKAPIFFMTRNEPILHVNDSGWYMGCMNPEHVHENQENLECMTLYDAFLKRKEIQHWLTFPIETKIFINHASPPKVWIGTERCKLVPGSFVERTLM